MSDTQDISITSLFPVAIGRTNINRPISNSESACFDDVAKNIVQNTFNTRSGNFYVLELLELENIKKIINDSVVKYAKTVFNVVPTATFKITQSWMNYSVANQQHHMHSHPNSFISGVFYPQAQSNIDKITFRHKTHSSPFFINSLGNTFYSATSHSVGVSTGDIVLFPSWLEHYVPPLPNNYVGTRTSLAFNVFPENEMGTDYMLNCLKIKFD